VVLSDIDRRLLEGCLQQTPQSWERFVDRFLGLVLHVVNHTAQARSMTLSEADREDLAAEVFAAVVQDDFAILRRFRGQSSLATYLTVVARRLVVRQFAARAVPASLQSVRDGLLSDPKHSNPEKRMSDREEVERLLARLNGTEADVVRMYHLEGKSYREISAIVGMPENSIGPTLSRARSKLRHASGEMHG
jgi:RNA polymerase sigma-70 factor (ECF subfamily)